MPSSYKGVTIPAYIDTADGVKAVKDLVDGGSVVSRVPSNQKPGSPVEGHLIWNTTDKRYEYWSGTAWEPLYKADAGPRGKLGNGNVSAGGTFAGSYTTKAQWTISGVPAGRVIRVHTTTQVACAATSNPDINVKLSVGGTLLDERGFATTGSGFYRSNFNNWGVFTSLGGSMIFNVDAKVNFGNGWNHEGTMWVVEDLGAA